MRITDISQVSKGDRIFYYSKINNRTYFGTVVKRPGQLYELWAIWDDRTDEGAEYVLLSNNKVYLDTPATRVLYMENK